MMKNFKKINGVAMLPLVLLIGGLITAIALTITLTSSLLNHSSAAIKWSSEALAGAQTGVDDGIIKIIRDNNYSGTSTLAIGNANVTVAISPNDPTSGKDTITSCGVVRSSQKKLQAVVNIDAITGQVNIESIQEIAIGESCQSGEVSAISATIPSAPQSLSATAGNTQIVLSWSAPSSNGGSSITGYKVYRGTTSGGETLLITLGNVLTYTNISLTNGTTYYYKVSAVSAIGEGSQSNEASTTPVLPATVPSAPQSLTATPGNTQIVLNWSAPSSNGGSVITNYKVYRGTTSGGEGETPIITLGNVLTYTNSGLTNGTTYYYKVLAVNVIGDGSQSSEASATPSAPPEPSAHYYTTSGTWTCPAGVTSIKIELYGAGGGGGGANSNPSAGGGGGAYSRLDAYEVVPTTEYSIEVGVGGAGGGIDGSNGGDGGQTVFWDEGVGKCVAREGTGGGGTGSQGGGSGGETDVICDVNYDGGDSVNSTGPGSGGGSSAGTGSNGNDSAMPAGGSAPTGGYAGGNGAAPGNGNPPPSGISGGGGGAAGTGTGGDGGSGYVILTY